MTVIKNLGHHKSPSIEARIMAGLMLKKREEN
jgi:hypothetical protein